MVLLAFVMGGRVETGFEPGITRFSQKLKLLGNGEFNYLTIILTYFIFSSTVCRMSDRLNIHQWATCNYGDPKVITRQVVLITSKLIIFIHIFTY
jgi:hypothetical protein